MTRHKSSSIFLTCTIIGAFLLSYVIPHGYKTFGIIAILIMLVPSLIMNCSDSKLSKIALQKDDLLCWTLLTVFTLLAIYLHQYSKLSLLYSIVFLLLSYIVVNLDFSLNKITTLRILCNSIGIVVAINLLIYILQGSSEPFVLLSMFDKNWSGVFLLYYFAISLYTKSIRNIVVCLIASFLCESRMLMLSEIICTLIYYIAQSELSNTWFRNIKYKKLKMWLFLILMFVFTYILSSFWITVIVPYGPSISGESFNDTSNASRMISNLYGFDFVFSDTQLILEGYDNDIFDKLGIVNDTSETNRVDGFRIVQPHNVFLNFVLRHGSIISLLYYYILSSILIKVLNRKNLFLIVPVFFDSLIFHTLLSNYNLLFLILIISLFK